jgi:hypothetical protein
VTVHAHSDGGGSVAVMMMDVFGKGLVKVGKLFRLISGVGTILAVDFGGRSLVLVLLDLADTSRCRGHRSLRVTSLSQPSVLIWRILSDSVQPTVPILSLIPRA